MLIRKKEGSTTRIEGQEDDEGTAPEQVSGKEGGGNEWEAESGTSEASRKPDPRSGKNRVRGDTPSCLVEIVGLVQVQQEENCSNPQL